MFNSKNLIPKSKVLVAIGLSAGITSTFLSLEALKTSQYSFASPGFLEFQWDPEPGHRKLRYFQSSNERMDRATYYFFLRPKERRTGILKLTLQIPDYFKAKLTTKKFSLCKVKVGGVSGRTKCLKDIPAVFELNQDQTRLDIFPDAALPLNKDSYAIKMKIFNPRERGMFQFHAFSQSPGDLPISSYLGTWNLTIQ